MTALNGQGQVVRFDGQDKHLLFTIDRLAMLEDHFGSFDAMTDLMLSKPVGTNRLVLLVAIGEIREADLDPQEGREPKLRARVRELSPKIESTPGDVMSALSASLNAAMGASTVAGAADPTKATPAPTPGSTS
jgi:hypothetical protein